MNMLFNRKPSMLLLLLLSAIIFNATSVRCKAITTTTAATLPVSDAISNFIGWLQNNNEKSQGVYMSGDELFSYSTFVHFLVQGRRTYTILSRYVLHSNYTEPNANHLLLRYSSMESSEEWNTLEQEISNEIGFYQDIKKSARENAFTSAVFFVGTCMVFGPNALAAITIPMLYTGINSGVAYLSQKKEQQMLYRMTRMKQWMHNLQTSKALSRGASSLLKNAQATEGQNDDNNDAHIKQLLQQVMNDPSTLHNILQKKHTLHTLFQHMFGLWPMLCMLMLFLVAPITNRLFRCNIRYRWWIMLLLMFDFVVCMCITRYQMLSEEMTNTRIQALLLYRKMEAECIWYELSTLQQITMEITSLLKTVLTLGLWDGFKDLTIDPESGLLLSDAKCVSYHQQLNALFHNSNMSDLWLWSYMNYIKSAIDFVVYKVSFTTKLQCSIMLVPCILLVLLLRLFTRGQTGNTNVIQTQ